MANPFVPYSHADREVCIRSVDDYIRAPDAKPSFVAEVGALFQVARDAYRASRRTYRELKGKADQAASAVEDADGRFDRAWRRWARSVTDDDGKARTSEVAAMLNGRRPGDVPLLPYADEVTLAAGLFTQLASRPDLVGDAEALAELKAATVHLGELTTAWEAARRRQREAGVALDRDTVAFDVAYGKCRRVGHALLDEGARKRVFPVFQRSASDDSEG